VDFHYVSLPLSLFCVLSISHVCTYSTICHLVRASPHLDCSAVMCIITHYKFCSDPRDPHRSPPDDTVEPCTEFRKLVIASGSGGLLVTQRLVDHQKCKLIVVDFIVPLQKARKGNRRGDTDCRKWQSITTILHVSEILPGFSCIPDKTQWTTKFSPGDNEASNL
jgi:hypothetical protein